MSTTEAKPFPYWPATPSEDQLKRNEIMLELDKWNNNDTDLARRSAETLIILLARQFSIDLMKIEL